MVRVTRWQCQAGCEQSYCEQCLTLGRIFWRYAGPRNGFYTAEHICYVAAPMHCQEKEKCYNAGYCSLAHFSEGELGVPLPADKTPAHLHPLMEAASKTAAPPTPQQSVPAKAAGSSLPHSMRSTPAGAEQPDQAAGTAQPRTTVLKQIEPATQEGMPGRPATAAQQAPKQLPAQPAAEQEGQCQGLVPLQKASLAEEGSSKRPLTGPVRPGSAGAGSAAKKQKRIMPTAMAAPPAASPLPAAPTPGDCAFLRTSHQAFSWYTG